MNSQLERGIQYSLQGWLPVSDALLSEVRANCQSGRYRDDPALMIREIKADPSLTLYVLRKYCEAESAKGSLENSPEAILSPDHHAALEAMLQETSGLVSNHRFSDVSLEQTGCMIRTAVAAVTSEHLGSHEGLDRDAVFTTACLRHLGQLLIAWNYPHLYSKVLSEQSAESNLDRSLHALIGFSPALLAVTIAQRWFVNPEVRLAVGDSTVAEFLSPEEVQRAKTLEQICRTGEALSRAMYPEIFPTADSDWEDASDAIRAKLGPHGMRSILTAVRDYIKQLQTCTSTVFALPQALSAPEKDSLRSASRVSSNRYLKDCPPQVQQMLTEIYKSLTPDSVSRESLEVLIRRVVPASGFQRGCIYLLNPESMTLEPRVPLGAINVRHVSPHPFSGAATSPISSALTSIVPQELQQSVFDLSAQDAIAGALGIEQKTGVLYLEVGDDLRQRPARDRLQVFKALRQAFNDVLQLE